MRSLPSFIIYSLSTPNKPYTGDVPKHHKSCEGVYNNQTESSYIAPLSDLKTIRAVTSVFKQECILICDNGSCYLEYDSNEETRDYIGQWTKISKMQATTLNNYTKQNDNFFAAM